MGHSPADRLSAVVRVGLGWSSSARPGDRSVSYGRDGGPCGPPSVGADRRRPIPFVRVWGGPSGDFPRTPGAWCGRRGRLDGLGPGDALLLGLKDGQGAGLGFGEADVSMGDRSLDDFCSPPRLARVLGSLCVPAWAYPIVLSLCARVGSSQTRRPGPSPSGGSGRCAPRPDARRTRGEWGRRREAARLLGSGCPGRIGADARRFFAPRVLDTSRVQGPRDGGIAASGPGDG